ncbi:MAG: DUF6603 domain-containing protein [Bryobacteraceae bacterium]
MRGLDKIKISDPGGRLQLGKEELGERLLTSFQSWKVFYKSLELENAQLTPLSGQQTWLDFRGKARGVFGRNEVVLRVRLFDVNNERTCLIWPEESNALDGVVQDWLSSFDVDPWEVLTELEGVDWCVISSSDYDASWDTIPAPIGWPQNFQLRQVVKGVQCRTQKLEFDSDFQSGIEKKIGTSAVASNGATFLRVAPAASRWPYEGLGMLHLRAAALSDTKLPLGRLNVGLAGAEVLLPIDDTEEYAGPLVSVRAELTLDEAPNKPKFEVTAIFDVASETVLARIAKPQSLTSLPGLSDGAAVQNPPEFLNNLLARTNAEAWILMGWGTEETDSQNEKVLAIGGRVGFDPIELIPEVIKFGGSLSLEAEYPFNAERREFKGSMMGDLSLWHQGQKAASLEGSVEIPGWYFRGEAQVKVQPVMGALGLGEIQLPDQLKDSSVTLSVAGGVETKYLSAALQFERGKEWKETGAEWALSDLLISADYDSEEDEFQFSLAAKLDFRTFEFKVLGEYDGGWTVRGDLVAGKLDVSQATKSLLEGLTLPSNMPDGLVLEDVGFAAELSTGDFSLRGRMAREWGLIPQAKLQIEQLQFDRKDKKTRAALAVRLTLGGIEFLLSASTPGSTDAGWLFQGSTGPGQQIPIGTLITKLVKELDKDAAVPPALEGFTVENLGVSFNTQTSAFKFTCEGKIPLGDGGPILSCKGAIEVEKDQSTGKSKSKFAGAVSVGQMDFRFDLLLAPNEQELKATWKDEGVKPELNLKSLSADLPDLPLQNLLIPKEAKLQLKLGETRKTLSIYLETEWAKAAFYLDKDTSKSGSATAAFGLKPQDISTSKIGGPLGPVLEQYNIKLTDLLIVAANADVPKFPFNGEGAISKGVLLKGALKFGETSFSYPFECNLGGKPAKKETAAITDGIAETPAPQGKKPEAEEGKNNVKVGQKIGPLRFRKVRFETRSDQDGMRVFVLLDASLGSGGFDLDLEGFNVNFPLTALTNLTDGWKSIGVGLDGLSIAYSNPPLLIAGGFSRVEAELPYIKYLYTGHLLIKAETFQIAVFGSYGTIQVGTRTEPSLFAYGMYDGVIGGPAAFFVTGLALGGGYNTRLSLPPVEEVAKFPLVQAVTDPAKFTPSKLRDAVKPSAGDYWLALGIKFTSFKMAESFALFTVAFGNRLQFALLGLTKFSHPVGSTKDKCVVYAELAIRAVLDPDGGVFSFEGRLTSDSYVFSKEIRLVGGFAFFIWFGKAKEAGDFVISLGGYHPEFAVSTKPHYPVVPRIGVEGNIQNVLTIRGGAYLALTPSCLMAGLQVEAVFDTKDVRAAFIAYAHFIVAWAPFRYDARIGIGIAVTVKFLRSFKLEISADLHIWGPPFQGTARVTLYILSFTVEFGERVEPKREPLGWPAFREQFLPARSDDKNRTQFGTIRISEGLQREVKKDDKVYRIVNPHELMIETDSSVPCSEVKFGRRLAHGEGKKDLGIRPMAAKSVESVQQVRIRRENSASEVDDETFRAVQWSKKSFPEALWSPAEASDKPEAKMIENVPSGVVLRVQHVTPPQALGPFGVEKFKYYVVPKTIPWGMAQTPPKVAPKGNFQGVAKDNALRTEIRASLPALTKRGWNPISLQKTSDNAMTFFQAPPTVAALGEGL